MGGGGQTVGPPRQSDTSYNNNNERSLCGRGASYGAVLCSEYGGGEKRLSLVGSPRGGRGQGLECYRSRSHVRVDSELPPLSLD